jgi:hypothetical protein
MPSVCRRSLKWGRGRGSHHDLEEQMDCTYCTELPLSPHDASLIVYHDIDAKTWYSPAGDGELHEL